MKAVKVFMLVAALVLLSCAVPVQADAAGAVTSVSAHTTGYVNVSPDIVRFNFEGKITTNGPTVVKYRWIRSDGAIAPVQTLVFSGADSKIVTSYWQLGKLEHPRHLWKAVEILSPNRMTSNRVQFTVPPKGGLVTRLQARSTGYSNVGPDTVRFNFEGRIVTNGPATVKYQWIRSDGAIAPVETLVFPSASSKIVTTYWQLGKRNEPLHLWEAVKILSPNAMTSNKAHITVPPKRGQVTHVQAVSTGHVDLDRNTVRFNFQGKITTNGPATVKYRWIRSDGATAPLMTLVFSAAGTKEVTTYWQLGKRETPLRLWEAVEIQSPNAMTSNKAHITLPAR